MTQVYLYPGELYASSNPTVITTILGSCVAIALHDVRLKIGGLNHYLLADAGEGAKPEPKYASYAIHALYEAMIQLGSQQIDLRAKVFGGANVLDGVQIGIGVGQGNIETAFRSLEKLGIPVVAHDVGGVQSRKIIFNTCTFDIQRTFHIRQVA